MRWLALAALVPAAWLPQTPSFRASTTRVAVDVAVLSGRTPVTGLTAADFVVIDNGVSQRVDEVGSSEVPLDVSLVVDVSGSTADQLRADRQDVTAVAAMLRPIDRLRVIGFASEVTEIQPLAPAGPGHAPPVERLETGGLSSVYDGIAAALMRRVDPGRRHLVVAYTDGLENRSVLSGDQLLAIGQVSDAVLHLVASGSVPPVDEIGGNCGPKSKALRDAAAPKPAPCSDDPPLEQTVAATGGSVHPGTKIADTFQRILREFMTRYVVYFQPTNVSQTGWHELQIKVTHGGYTVHARRGYYAGR